MSEESHFNERSDNAGRTLKAEIGRRLGKELPPSPVAVGPDGKPPLPPPPPGSYMTQNYEAQRAEAAQAAVQAQATMPAGQPTPQQVLGDQPPVGTPNQQSDGSVAPPLVSGQPQPAAAEVPPQAPQLSEGANSRIQQLIFDLREKDRQILELSGSQRETEKVKKQVEGLLKERDTFLESNLDNLDPDQRAQILAEARFREILDQNNASLMEKLQPRLDALSAGAQQTDMEKVADKYPGFDMAIHPTQIDMFRAKHGGISYEMAFKAIAVGDEAVPRQQVSANAVPPVVPAGSGAPLPKWMPEPTPNPDDELVDFQQRTNKLLRSADPADHRQGLRQMDEAIAARISGSSYQGRPKAFD